MTAMRRRMEAGLAAAFNTDQTRAVAVGRDAIQAERVQRMRRFLEAVKDSAGVLPRFVNAGFLAGLFLTTPKAAKDAISAARGEYP